MLPTLILLDRYMSQIPPEKWYENGQTIPDIPTRMAYYETGLKKGEEFHSWAWKGIGDTRHVQGDLVGAEAAYVEACDLSPTDADL